MYDRVMALAASVRGLHVVGTALATRLGTASVQQARLLSQRMHVTHVIYDFDGLLVDTESCYTIANKRMLGKFGREYTPELNSKIMGRKESEAIPWLLKEAGIADKITPTEYLAEYDAMLAEMFLTCKAMPGAERLVRHLSNKGIPQAICSGSRGKTFRERREPHKDWLDLIKLQVFCGDEPEVKRGKPYPDPYLFTMNKFPTKPKDPSEVLVFEDAPNGGRSAKAAGMKCVMVPHENHRDEALKIGVTQVLHSLTDFQPQDFGLPPFD